MGWTSYYTCDWCKRHSEHCIREDSLIAAGWKFLHLGAEYVRAKTLLCFICVGRAEDALERTKDAL